MPEKTAEPSMFAADSSSAGGADPNAGIFSDHTRSDFLVGCVRTFIDPNTNLQKVYGMENDQLFTEFNARAARQMSLSAEVRMRAEYNIREKRRLKFPVDEKDKLLKAKDKEIENLKAHMSLRDEVNALNRRNIILEKERNALDVKVAYLEASTKLSSYENSTERLEEFHDAQLQVVNDTFDKIYAYFVEMALHLEERFYPHLLTTISGRRWLLTYGMELAIYKCPNSFEYLSALGATIGEAIEKGMQDGLSARNTHGMEGRALTDVTAYNPFTEAVTFLPCNIGLTELQPPVNQLMVPIHHSPDKSIISATSLSFALDVYNIRVQKIRENIVGTYDTNPATVVATMTLSTTLASASTVSPIFVDDYKVMDTDDQAGTDGNADPFPNVDDAELNIL
nr:hypothetical protein [Tanacetum cinerariifolium]GFA65351.1 hypothetical protein [Tanacetum cinerariifolium]